MPERQHDDFFVGYLPWPARIRRFVLVATGLLLALFLAAGTVASALRAPPHRTEQQPGSSLVGVIDAQAYGILWTLNAASVPEPVLLSRGGKFGAPGAVKALQGKVVRLDGLLLERDGYRLLEVGKVDPKPEVSSADRAKLAQLPRRTLGRRTLRGEIVDIKCWLGRMKPGDGRTHRACAQFCIAGGIPPVLVAKDSTGEERRFVLTTEAGLAVNDAVLPFVAEAVELDGQVDEQGGLLFLRIDPTHIRRL